MESYVGANSTNPSFVLYVYEEGYDPYNTYPITPTTDTHTTPPIANITTPPITTTTTTTNTVIACKACDICGTIIDANDGVTTPLGVFVCPSCKSAGAGGTRPPFQTDTVTSTTTTTTTTIMIDKMCHLCGCLAAAEYGVTTSDGKFICSYCYLHSDDIEYKSCDVCGKIINIDDGINTPIAFVCKECRSVGMGGTRPQFPTNNETTTTTTATAEVTTYGDSNSDGKVNIADSVLIMQCLANPDEFQMNAEQADAADVYNRGDGITTMDALAIQMTSISLISVEDLPVSAE